MFLNIVKIFTASTFEPGLCTRNLFLALTDYNIGTCSILTTYHNDAMLPLQKPVRAPILQPFKTLTTKSNA